MPRPSANRVHSGTMFGSRTDIGCVREHNEDSLVVAPPLYAVADGMAATPPARSPAKWPCAPLPKTPLLPSIPKAWATRS